MRNVWDRYEPTATSWNFQRVVHLHRRAGLGADWKTVQRDLQSGPEVAVSRLLSPQATRNRVEAFESTATTIGESAVGTQEAGLLKGWWVYRMLFSPHPLAERITLFWHNHFATSNQKVRNLRLMRRQNETFRRLCLARFSSLLSESVKDPALLIWLDAPRNRKGACNENLAREIMELFTLGLDNYTEQDIKQAARALTGWTVVNDKFAISAPNHDTSTKTIFGKSGAWDGDDLLQLLLEQPHTPHFICDRICEYLISPSAATPEERKSLSEEFAKRDMDIRWLIETILRSKAFFGEKNIRLMIVAPVPYMVSSIRALEILDPPPSTAHIAVRAARAGQDLFFPPNVAGWTSGTSWITTQTMVMRYKFADDLLAGRLHRANGNGVHVVELLAKHDVSTRLTDATRFAVQLLCGVNPSNDHVERIVHSVAESESTADEKLRRLFATVLSCPEAQLG